MDIKILASGSTGNCYRISDGKTSLLLDAGIPFKKIQVECRFKISDIQGCLITHTHLDHSKAAKDLVKNSIDVYTSQGTIAACNLTGHRIHAVSALSKFNIGTFEIIPFDVEHDAPEPLGFVMASAHTGEKLLYITDTYYIKYKFQGLTHIMAECNYDAEILYQNVRNNTLPDFVAKRIIKSHMNINNFLDMLKVNDLSKIQQIYLLHLSDSNGNEIEFKEKVQKLVGTEVYVF